MDRFQHCEGRMRRKRRLEVFLKVYQHTLVIRIHRHQLKRIFVEWALVHSKMADDPLRRAVIIEDRRVLLEICV